MGPWGLLIPAECPQVKCTLENQRMIDYCSKGARVTNQPSAGTMSSTGTSRKTTLIKHAVLDQQIGERPQPQRDGD